MMVAEKNVECLKLTKEIYDLNVEMETVQKMYIEKNMQLQEYIENYILKKYEVEKIIYNMVNKTSPSTYYEYVNSVYIFLGGIKAKKMLELSKKL